MAKRCLIIWNECSIVTTLHGTDITLVGNHPFYKPAVKFSIEQSDVVTSVSESLRQDTIDFFGVEREIKVVSNFVDLDKFKTQLLDVTLIMKIIRL